MKKYAYGQQPSDLPAASLALGWLAGVRHLKSLSATGSFWHAHGEIQLLFCLKGEFSYEFRDLPPEVLTAGHFIVIPAKTEHRHLQAIDPAGHRVELLIDATPAKGPYALFPTSVTRSVIARLTDRICTPIPCSRELTALFRELDALAASDDRSPASLALARTLATLVLLRCADSGRNAVTPKTDERLMDEAVAWLEAHYPEDIRLDRLVAYMGYSRSRLFEMFKKHTGLTPADWLARRRIREARRLLETTDRHVSEIAAACGFASHQYFNAAFRRQTGSTPTEWRRNH